MEEKTGTKQIVQEEGIAKIDDQAIRNKSTCTVAYNVKHQ